MRAGRHSSRRRTHCFRHEPGRTIFWYAKFGWSGIAETFCPALILALSWPRYHVRGALAYVVTGALCVPIFKFAVPLIPEWGPV